MKRIKVFFGELVFQKGPEHTLRIIFVGCIALSVAAVLLGLFMLLPPAAVQAEDTPSATVDENPQQGSEAPRSESGLGQSHPVPGEPRSESEVTSFQGPQQAMGQLPEPAGGQPEGPSSGVEERGQLKKLMDGGMNRAQANLFLTRKEQLAKDSSGIISCSWREQRNDYLIVTDAKRKYKIKNGNNWLEQTQTYTIGFKGNQINNMTDYNGVSVYENMERKKGYVPLTPEMIEAGTEYMAQQVCEKNKNWFSAADPYSFHYSGRITIEFATDELHQGYNSNDEIQFVDVLLKDGKLYLSGSVYVSFPDDPKFHEEVSAYNDRGIRTLILAVFQQNTILKNGAFNPNSLIELRVYEYVEGLF